MKRRRYADGEQDQLQKLRNENTKLKGQISKLRKQLSRIDVDRFQNLKDLLDSQDRLEQEEASQAREAGMWSCWDCKKDVLKLVVMERRDGVFYFRKCSCGRRTKTQKYTDTVKGIKE